jgi:LmbE family N-acetylglucosaminyl deacetylase
MRSTLSSMRTIHAGLSTGIALLLAAMGPAREALGAPGEFGHFSHEDVLLVVAPHPDDETLCCAGAIQQARAAGARVAIVWITSGDAFEFDAHVVEHRWFTGTQGLLELARLRMQESARAAELLGVAPAERFFLGYPDGGIAELLGDGHAPPYRSAHTGVAAVPYAQALRPGAAYTGENLERDLTTVIERVHPTWVLAPTPLDAHADHRATGELVIRALAPLRQLDRARYWIVHAGVGWPWPPGLHPQDALVPPRRARALSWEELALSPAERATKERAIRVYATQLALISSFMLSFVKRNEIYASAPAREALRADEMRGETAAAAASGASGAHAVK